MKNLTIEQPRLLTASDAGGPGWTPWKLLQGGKVISIHPTYREACAALQDASVSER